jgi:anti-anti-sigma regulatory factor
VRGDRAHPVVAVTGALDGAGAELLAAVLEHVGRAGRTPVAVDLSRVTSADEAGLEPVLAGGAEMRRPSPAVQEVLPASRLRRRGRR